jgi:hypothetical protein
MGMQALKSRINNNVRSDGYSSTAAQAVCRFQSAVESGVLGKADYAALRSVLQFARGQELTYEQLVSLYHTTK